MVFVNARKNCDTLYKVHRPHVEILLCFVYLCGNVREQEVCVLELCGSEISRRCLLSRLVYIADLCPFDAYCHVLFVCLTCTLLQDVGKQGIRVTLLHGGKTQEGREQALDDFKSGVFDVIICTDVAGRGIDISGVRIPSESFIFVGRELQERMSTNNLPFWG